MASASNDSAGRESWQCLNTVLGLTGRGLLASGIYLEALDEAVEYHDAEQPSHTTKFPV